jgi:hypothetical protein
MTYEDVNDLKTYFDICYQVGNNFCPERRASLKTFFFLFEILGLKSSNG